MGLIEGTKQYRISIVGVIPPNVPEEAFIAGLMAGVSVGLNLTSTMKYANVEVGSNFPVPQQPGQGRVSE